MKIWLPKIEDRIGGGWSFLRNFIRGCKDEIVYDWHEADIVFIPGVTLVERNDIEEAYKAGKKIVLRVDNIPKKSRNKRNRVLDNLKRYAEIAQVVYQSEWAKEYCKPLTGNGIVILNGVDQSIFYPGKKPDHPIYLFAFHGKNEIKGFGIAHYLFEQYFREDPKSEFKFIYNFKSELAEQMDSNYDFWNGEKFKHLPPVDQRGMANLMRQCTHLIYPAYADAAPNLVLEARACGLEVVGTLDSQWSGVAEMLNLEDISLERMCQEYHNFYEQIQRRTN